jgi:hypothetical protein
MHQAGKFTKIGRHSAKAAPRASQCIGGTLRPSRFPWCLSSRHPRSYCTVAALICRAQADIYSTGPHEQLKTTCISLASRASGFVALARFLGCSARGAPSRFAGPTLCETPGPLHLPCSQCLATGDSTELPVAGQMSRGSFGCAAAKGFSPVSSTGKL